MTRIVFRYATGDVPSTEHLEPGEPVFDNDLCRIGIGDGGQSPRWYPAIDTDGYLSLNSGQAITSSSSTATVHIESSGLVVKDEGRDVLRATGVPSSVNSIRFTNSITNVPPVLEAEGTDTNIGITLRTKGTGVHQFATIGGTQFRVTDTANAVNYLSVTGAVSGAGAVLAAAGASTNVDLVLRPKGAGVVRFGSLTPASDLNYIGFVYIRDDASGNLLKLAVVS